jgi:predicted component of type VI protein secretion system
MSDAIVEVRVSLKGRLVKTHRFSQERITIGRDPKANLFLDNPGISRAHAELERRGDMLYVVDLDSANGTFVNDEQVKRERVGEHDQIRIGKFLVEVRILEDRRGTTDGPSTRSAEHEGTMVLDAESIKRVMERTRAAEEKAGVGARGYGDPQVVGNVVRSPYAIPTTGNIVPMSSPRRGPRPFSLAWWRSQVWGVVIGFIVGFIACILAFSG